MAIEGVPLLVSGARQNQTEHRVAASVAEDVLVGDVCKGQQQIGLTAQGNCWQQVTEGRGDWRRVLLVVLLLLLGVMVVT